MTVAKMTLLTGASPGTDQDDPNRQAISNQLSMPTVRVPILGGPDESTESVSYFDSRDNAIPISRIGLQTPPANVEISYNPDQDMPSLGSWDLDEAYPVVLSLNGIGLANREHASPRFCARPLEEVSVMSRPFFSYRQALRSVCPSPAAWLHLTYLKMAKLHCTLQLKAAGCPLCSSFYDYNPTCSPKTQWAAPACISLYAIHNKASSKN